MNDLTPEQEARLENFASSVRSGSNKPVQVPVYTPSGIYGNC